MSSSSSSFAAVINAVGREGLCQSWDYALLRGRCNYFIHKSIHNGTRIGFRNHGTTIAIANLVDMQNMEFKLVLWPEYDHYDILFEFDCCSLLLLKFIFKLLLWKEKEFYRLGVYKFKYSVLNTNDSIRSQEQTLQNCWINKSLNSFWNTFCHDLMLESWNC